MKRRATFTLAAALALALAAAAGATPPRDDDAQPLPERVAPTATPEELHRRWQPSVSGRGRRCEWPSYLVGVHGTHRTLTDALRDAAAESVCGPTVFLPSGRHEIGLAVLTKPTIIKGEAGTTLAGTILNASGVPLWLEDLAFVDAPFPGALIVSHPDADTTVVRVTVSGATGLGIMQNGGRFEAWHSRVEDTRAVARDEMVREGLPLEIPVGPAAGSDERPGRVRFPGRHKLGLALAAHNAEAGWMTRGQNLLSTTESFLPVVLTEAANLCSGAGMVFSGGVYAEITDVASLFNAGAGLAAYGWPTWVNAQSATFVVNGFARSAESTESHAAAVDSGACFGGVTVRDDATMLAEQVGLTLNVGYGLLVAHGGAGGFADVFAAHSVALPGAAGGNVSGDNVLVWASYLALSDFALEDAVRVGFHLTNQATGTLVDGVITENAFGLVAAGLSSGGNTLYLDDVDIFGNTEENVVVPGDLAVPESGVPVPPVP